MFTETLPVRSVCLPTNQDKYHLIICENGEYISVFAHPVLSTVAAKGWELYQTSRTWGIKYKGEWVNNRNFHAGN